MGLVPAAAVAEGNEEPESPQGDPDAQLRALPETPEARDVPEALTGLFERLTGAEHSFAQRRDAAAALLSSEASRAHPEAAAALLARALSDEHDAEVWHPTLQTLAFHETPPPEALVGPLLRISDEVDARLRPHLAAALGRLIDTSLADWLAARARGHDPPADVGGYTRTLADLLRPQPHEAEGDAEGGAMPEAQRQTSLPAEHGPSLRARQAAVLALGHHRTRSSAAVLITLTEPEHPSSIRQAAFTALETLTGLSHLGADPDAWQQWWSEARELSERAWEHMLLENLARRAERQRLDQRQLSSRLQELVRNQYRATGAEQRAALLARLLNDPLEPVRELAMTLSVQRLVDDGPFDEPLREALRARLDDSVPEIRQRAALLLRDLADAPAADRAATRLASGRESVVTVLRAKLLMLTRLPRAAAVEPAAELLGHASLSGEAAAMLAAAVEAGLVSRAQRGRILERLRWALAEQPPRPQVVRLLGRLGGEPDWQRIREWLDSDDAPVKQAAAHVWAESSRSLMPLASRADDPQIGPVFVRVAAQRGRTPATLEALLEHPPGEGEAEAEQREQWQRALIALAGRVPSAAVGTAVDRLGEMAREPALREAMLSAALERFEHIEPLPPASEESPAEGGGAEQDEHEHESEGGDDGEADAGEPAEAEDAGASEESDGAEGIIHRPRRTDPTHPFASQPSLAIEIGDPAPDGANRLEAAGQGLGTAPTDPLHQRATLLLMRAKVRLEAGRYRRAVEDLETVLAFGEAVSAEQRRLATGRLIRAHLGAANLEQAASLARGRIEAERSDAASITATVELFLDAMTVELEAEELGRARAIMERLDPLIEAAGEAVGAETADRLLRVERRLDARLEHAEAEGETEAAVAGAEPDASEAEADEADEAPDDSGQAEVSVEGEVGEDTSAGDEAVEAEEADDAESSTGSRSSAAGREAQHHSRRGLEGMV